MSFLKLLKPIQVLWRLGKGRQCCSLEMGGKRTISTLIVFSLCPDDDLFAVKMVPESFSEHIKRRAAVLTARLELELSVSGTEFAPLERAVFKSTT